MLIKVIENPHWYTEIYNGAVFFNFIIFDKCAAISVKF